MSNIFNTPEYYRALILKKDNLLQYDIQKNKGKSLVYVFFTAFCGVGCPFCFFNSPAYTQKMKKAEELEKKLNFEGVKKFIEFANASNIGYLQISGGGEPFLEKNAILETIQNIDAERIVLVTSGAWAYVKEKGESYLAEIYEAVKKRKKTSKITIRLSVSEQHDLKLHGRPIIHLIDIFERKYRDDKNFTLQIKIFEGDNALINILDNHFSGYQLNLIGENLSDGNDYVKIMPWKYSLVLPSGFSLVVGKARIFYPTLIPNLNDNAGIQDGINVYNKDLSFSQNHNSSLFYKTSGETGLDRIVEYNGNVATWQNRVLDNPLNIYEDSYEEILKQTYQDIVTYSYIDKGSLYRERILNEIAPHTVQLMKAINIRDYIGPILFYEEKVKLYYVIRTIQDYLKEGKINLSSLAELPISLQESIYLPHLELKKMYEDSNYTIIDQELQKPFTKEEIYDLLALINLGHYKVNKQGIDRIIKYYNTLFFTEFKTLSEFKISKNVGTERRLAKRIMKRKRIKKEQKEKFFYLFRHGETNWNVEGKLKGQLENIQTFFTQLGELQIADIQNLLQEYKIEVIFSSDLERAYQSANIANFKHLPLYYFKKLRGFNMGEFQGKTVKEFLENEIVQLAFRDHSIKIPGGESINDLISRLLDALVFIFNNYYYEKNAIFSHGAAISNLKAYLTDSPYEDIDYCVIKVFKNTFEVIDYGCYKKKIKNIFLTSDIGGVKKKEEHLLATPFIKKNSFFSNLVSTLKNRKKLLLIASDPFAYEKNDLFLDIDKSAFFMSDVQFEEYAILDYRGIDSIDKILKNVSLIVFSGGNTYEQNKFFQEIELYLKLKKIDCPIVGISAGAMNCGETVINSSQKSKNPDLPLLLKGLGISKYTIIPHFEQKQNNPDELKLILEASQTTKIYALRDGSYIRNDTIYGECALIYQGKITKICENGKTLLLQD